MRNEVEWQYTLAIEGQVVGDCSCALYYSSTTVCNKVNVQRNTANKPYARSHSHAHNQTQHALSRTDEVHNGVVHFALSVHGLVAPA